MADAIQVFKPGFRVTDELGVVQSGATLEFYAAGTSTPRTVYSDKDLSVSLGTTITCDSGGYPAASGNKVQVYTGTGAYKIVCKKADTTTLWTHDNIIGALDTTGFDADTAYPVTTISTQGTDFTVPTTHSGVLHSCNVGGGSITVTFPSAVTAGNGFSFGLRHAANSTNGIKYKTVSSQTISDVGASAQYGSIMGYGEVKWFISDGVNWTVANYVPPLIAGGVPYFKVASRRSAPVSSPTFGVRYIINATPTGAWASYSVGDVVEEDGNGGYIRYTPKDGWLAYVGDENLLTQYRDTAWVDLSNITAPSSSTLKRAVFQHSVTNDTHGGTSVASAWTRLAYATQVSNNITSFAYNASSFEFTVPAGAYLVIMDHVFYQTGVSQLRLKNVGTDVIEIAGDQINLVSGNNVGGVATAFGVIAPTAATNYRPEYFTQNAVTDSGLGVRLSAKGINETYGTVTFIDLSSLQGPQGIQGIAGVNGLNGASYVYVQSGAANNADGANGDLYFRTDSPYTIYKKESGAWVAKGTMPEGPTGPAGPATNTYDTRAAAIAATVPTSVKRVMLHGYASAGDGGVAWYKYVGSEPTHSGKFQDAGGKWFELDEPWITPKMFGIASDGTGDQATALGTLFSVAKAQGVNVRIPAGTYRTGAVVLQDNIRVECNSGAVFNLIGASTARFYGHGSTTGTNRPLVSNATIGDLSVQLTTGHAAEFTAGEWVLVRDNTYIPGASPFGRNQEIARVDYVTGAYVVLKTPLIGAYQISQSAELVHLDAFENFHWRGGKINVPTGTNQGGGFEIKLAVGGSVLGFEVVGPDNLPGISVMQSTNMVVADCIIRDGQNMSGSNGYAINIEDSSHNIVVHNWKTDGCRENVIGNRVRNVVVSGGVANGMYYNGWNTHGRGAENVLITGNIFSNTRQGPAIAVGYTTADYFDRAVTITNNTISNCFTGAIQVAGTASYQPLNVIVAGNTVDGLGYNASSQIGVYVHRAQGVRVYGNRFARCAYQADTRAIYCNFAVRCDVVDNDIDLVLGTALRMENCTDTTFDRNRLYDVSGTHCYTLGTNTRCAVKRTTGNAGAWSYSIDGAVTQYANGWNGAEGGGISNVVEDLTPDLGGNLNVNGKKFVDANGNELLDFSATASAVNYLKVVNSATGNKVQIQAQGDDADVDVDIVAKGGGVVYVNGGSPYMVGDTVSIADGGTGQTTAKAARGSTGLDIENHTGVGDANYTILAADQTVVTTAALTTGRTWTLPTAASVNDGHILKLHDAAGGVTSTNTITLARAGSDTINGGTSFVIGTASFMVHAISDGVSAWTVGVVPAVMLPALSGDVTSTARTAAVTVKAASEDFAFKGDISPTALSGAVNDYNPTGLSTASVLRIDGGAANRDITGLQGGADGRVMVIHNIGTSNSLVLKNASTSSSAANRFAIGQDCIIRPDRSVTLQYDSTSSRWRMMHPHRLVQSGTVSISVSAGVYDGTTTVTYDVPFAATPQLVLTANIVGARRWVCAINSESSTGFTAWVFDVHGGASAGSTVTMHWIATL